MKRGDVAVGNLFMFDPFEVFGLEKKYSINMQELEKRYFNEQKKTHPDRFARGTDKEKEEAIKRSCMLNQAYTMLKDPIERARVLLKEEGVDLLSHHSETLAKVVEWNDRIEDAENLVKELEHEEEKLLKDLAEGIEQEAYEKARVALYQLTFVRKLLKDISIKASQSYVN